MRTRRTVASVAGAALFATALVIVPATAASAAYPVPTTWCQYRVTATGGLLERNTPTTREDNIVWPGFSYNQVVVAGQNGTVVNDGYTWRRIADGHGSDGFGGWSASNWLLKLPNTCVS